MSITRGLAFSISSNRIVVPEGFRLMAASVLSTNSENRDSAEYSFMKRISSGTPDPNRYSVNCFADSVFPTPVGPRKRKLLLGRSDNPFNPSSDACKARAIRAIASVCPRIRPSR